MAPWRKVKYLTLATRNRTAHLLWHLQGATMNFGLGPLPLC